MKPQLAHESTLAQEQEVSSATNNLKAYKLAVHHAAVSVSRRKPPDRIPHPSIGTVKQSLAATEAEAKTAAGRLTPARLEPYRINSIVLREWGYPDMDDSALQSPQEKDPPDAMRTCDRCKVDFVVTSSNETGPCTYHFGRLAPEVREGRRTWLYSCCARERGTPGCEEGIHVFSFRDDDRKLAAYAPYKTSWQVCKSKEEPSAHIEVVGMDCEMICESSLA